MRGCFKATYPLVLIFSRVLLSSPSLQERKRLKPEPIVKKEAGGSQTQNGDKAEKVNQEKEVRLIKEMSMSFAEC